MPSLPTLYIGVHLDVPEAVRKSKLPEIAKGIPAYTVMVPGVLAIRWPEDKTWEEALRDYGKLSDLDGALDLFYRAYSGQHTNGPQDALVKRRAHDTLMRAIKEWRDGPVASA